MYKRILVPLDGSTIAEQAVRPAIAIAKTTAARLSLVHIAEPGPAGLTYLPGPETYLSEIAERASAELNESVGFDVIRPEDVFFLTRADTAQLVADHCKEHEIQLVVMSTKGRGGVARAFIGSVADSLLRIAPCPVLLVRPRDDGLANGGGTSRIKSVLIALDQSPASEGSIDAVMEIADTNARLALLHVIVPMPVYAMYGASGLPETSTDDWSLYTDQADEYLRGVSNRLAASGFRVSRNTLASTDVPGAIVNTARQLKPDLIALASRAPHPFLRAIIGSVADDVIRHAPCPVLVTREV
jgi:nucleotide-binding universal stress UspA family protein